MRIGKEDGVREEVKTSQHHPSETSSRCQLEESACETVTTGLCEKSGPGSETKPGSHSESSQNPLRCSCTGQSARRRCSRGSPAMVGICVPRFPCIIGLIPGL